MEWDHLKKRSQTKIKTQFTDEIQKAGGLILTSPSDLGVCLNGGRRGASLGPKALINTLQNFSYTQDFPHLQASQVSEPEEESDFEQAQLNQAGRIHQALQLFQGQQVLHLGGGHDHVYPLLAALSKMTKNISIINIDAHLDTRTDDQPHSGTPFRQASKIWTHGRFRLFQVGIHDYANAHSNFEKLPQGEMNIFNDDDWSMVAGHIENQIDPEDEVLVLSLDADALSASIMEGVSAVNPNGLSLKFMNDCLQSYLEWTEGKKQYFGIYEYNPVYDNLSQKGARSIASLMHQYFSGKKEL
jgi:formiminoglutamase